jgi:hypothetical protein
MEPLQPKPRSKLKWFTTEVFLTWQFIAWAVFFVILLLLIFGKLNIGNIRAGSFEIAFEKRAKELGVYETQEFRNLKNINESDLKLFLIMGGEESRLYRFGNDALSSEAIAMQYKKLEDNSLMITKKISKDSTVIYSTEVGTKLHRALIQAIYSQLIK